MSRKFMFGAGAYKRAGWECYDSEIDIRLSLPFQNGCASHIHAEHVIEHVAHQQAWAFLKECHRMLEFQGRIRIAIPDLNKIWNAGELYWGKVSKSGSASEAVRAAIFNHGHRAAWNVQLLGCFLVAVGFKSTEICSVGHSNDPEMVNLEQHGKTVGEAINAAETSIVEGTK